jgi:hypothetical protein
MITCEVHGRFLEEMQINFGGRGYIRYNDNYGRNDNG